MIKVAILFAVTLVLSGCATRPIDPVIQATEFVSDAKSHFLQGNKTRAADLIDGALNFPTGGTKVAALFAQDKKAEAIYFSHIQTAILNISSIEAANSLFDRLLALKDGVVFSASQINDLFNGIHTKVATGNLNGDIPIRLSDNTVAFPQLKSADHQRAMLNRSINYLKSDATHSRNINSVMDFANRSGKNSPDWLTIEKSLPSMNIRRGELEIVSRVFPEFASFRVKQTTARVFVQVKNGDRLLTEDMLELLRKDIRGVEWVNFSGPGTTNIVVERIRNDEKTSPERTETITYAQYQVNLLSAALLMPRNASYIYEVVSGSTEIDFGYAVTAITEGKTVHDDLVRGKVGGAYSRCQNIRIQNVFGGVSSAGFIANDDMQARCSRPQAVELDDLRKEIFSKITASVLKIPAIAAVHHLD